jgi:uncharacterized membrane protein YphA (DoxX/SURF4 family)
MKTHTVTVVLRSLLGFIFVVGPLGTALHVFSEPALPPSAAAFVGALTASGYMLPLLWSTEIAAGALLLLGRLVPVALLLLAPVVVNIAAFHLFLAPGGLGIAVLISVLEGVLAWQHRATFAPLFTASTDRPESTAEHGARVARDDPKPYFPSALTR